MIIVNLLLERNPDYTCESGRTPLWLAAGNGCEAIVKLLRERKMSTRSVQINPAEYRFLGLPEVIMEGVVMLLLKRNVNPHGTRLVTKLVTPILH